MTLPPAMTSAQCREALIAYKAGDTKARDRVVVGCMRYVAQRARHFGRNGRNIEDLSQVGHIGVMHACDKFEPTRGIAFVTYARWWIDAEMMTLMRNEVRLVRLPNKNITNRVGAAIAAGHRTIDDIADATRISHETVAALLPGFMGRDVSIETFEQPETSQSPEVNAADSETRRRIDAALDSMSERHREVMREIYWGDHAEDGGPHGKGHAKVGAMNGVTRQRIQQIERVALQRLRVALRDLAVDR